MAAWALRSAALREADRQGLEVPEGLEGLWDRAARTPCNRASQ